jgi:hypothetical protein
MKKGILKTFVMIGLLAIVMGSTYVRAEETPTASSDVAFLSKYVWRGYAFSNDSIVIQPSVTVGYKEFGFNLWGNLDVDLDDGNPTTENSSEFNETDMTFSYETSYEKWSFGVGYIYYGLDSVLDTQELYLSIGYDTFLSPSLTIYRDMDTIPGWYWNLSVGHSLPLGEKYTLDLSGSIGYYSSDDIAELDDNLAPTGDTYSDFHDALLSASITFPISKYMSITPAISYSLPLSDSADNIITSNSMGLFGENDSDFFYGGITFSIAF